MKQITNSWFCLLASLALVTASACSDDETESGSSTPIPPTLSTDIPESGYHFLYSATTPKTFTLSTDAPWEITKDAGWFVVSPKSGEAGEQITITVSGAYNEADTREGSFVIRANSGNHLHPCYTEKTVTLTQDAYLQAGINVTGAEDGYLVFAADETTARTVKIEASYDWTLSADNESWYSLSPKSGKGGEETIVTVTPRTNTSAKTNKATLTIVSTDAVYPENSTQTSVALKQLMPVDTHAAGFSFYADDFGWISANWKTPYTQYGWPSVTTDGKNYNEFAVSEIEEAVTAKGYTHSSAVYARYEGHLKLGKSAEMGSITLPALSGIDTDKGATLLLQFDAAQYSSAGGAVDTGDNKMYVSVDGEATVGNLFDQAAGIELNNVWCWKRYSVLLYNVTSQTHITIGSTKAAKCRLYLDNIVLTRAADKGATAPAPVEVETALDFEAAINDADATYPTATDDVYNKEGNVVQEGANLVYTVRVNKAWTMESDCDWLTVAGVRCGASGSTGSNNGATLADGIATVTATGLRYNNITVAVAKNTESAVRTGHILVKVGTQTIHSFTVQQESGNAVRLSLVGITDNRATEFADSNPAAVKFTVTGTHDWSITPADTWFTVSPTSGKAGVKTEVTLSAVSANKGIRRISSFTIATIKPAEGEAATEQITVSQQTAAVGSAPWNMTSPIQWQFSVADMPKYTCDFDSSSPTGVNAFPSETTDGPGYLSYTHTAPSDPNGKCARVVGTTGEPYVTGAWPGDYWLFTVPVTNLAAGTKVHFVGQSKTSGTGQKYWLMEYKDGETWKPVSTPKTATVDGAAISYTHEHMNTTALSVDFTVTYENAISNGQILFRYTCTANAQASGKGALAAPNGGTIRWTTAGAPKIEIAQ